MSCDLTSSRNPYGYDLYEGDKAFVGNVKTQAYPHTLTTQFAQKQKPWKRLYDTPTLSSARHEVFHYDPRTPNDSIDFIIKAKYNQHEDLLPSKNDVVLQCETVDEDHGRILKNRVKEIIEPKPFHPLKVVVPQKARESIHSISNAIEGHHTQTTNRGYTRKPDGGNYAS